MSPQPVPAAARWILILFAIALPAAGGFLAFLQVVRSTDLGEPGLSGPVALALSPDGRHLYAAGKDDDALVVFARDDATGHLTYVDSYVDGVDGLFGLAAPTSIAVSPDDRHVYVTSDQDDTLVVFARDPTLDTLSFVEVEADGAGGVDGLGGASSVAVTPDDDLVLVAGYEDDALAIFARDPTTDDLTFVAAQVLGTGGVAGIDGASAVAVSPDSAYAYVAGGLDTAVAVFARDPTGDDFSFVEVESGGDLGGVTDLEISADGSNLYAAAYDDNAVTTYARDAGDGGLTLMAVHVDGAGGVDGLRGASSIAVREQLDLAFVAGQSEDEIAVFNRDPADGSLYFSQALANGSSGIEGLFGPSAVVASADGRFLYAAAEFEGAVVVLRIDAFDFGDAPSPYPTELADDGARHDYDPNGPFLGTSPDADPDGQPSSSVAGDDLTARADEDGVVFLDPLIPGDLVRVEVTVTAAAQLDAWIDFDDDGSWSETGDQIFADVTLAAGVHTLSFTVPATATAGVTTAARFRVSTAGGLDVTGSADDGEVEDHAVIIKPVAVPASGAFLAFREVVRAIDLGEFGLGVPVALAVSPDGRHLYAASSEDNALAVFTRDTASGELSFVDAYVDGTGGIFGLVAASGVAVSPDGRHVYVTAAGDDVLAVFARDSILDTLTFVAFAVQENGVGGVVGLDGAASVVVSPDDDLVLVASFDDDALAVFSRDATTDDLTFVKAQMLTDAGVDGIDGASAVAVSPDSGYAYVAGALDAAVAVFARDPTNDDFAFVEAEFSTDLDGVTGLEIPADGQNLYAAAAGSDTVTVFSRDAADGSLTLPSGLRAGASSVGGIDGASSVVVREQLDLAFVAGQDEDSIAVLNRDLDDGTLYLSQTLTNGSFNIEGLDGPRAVAASPDGKFLYAAAEAENAIVVLRIDAFDYGDAPAPYPTLVDDDGARHDYVPGAPFLGSTPDADPNGQPSAGATDDDLAALADEDGVIFLDPLLPGDSARVEVTVTAAARLDAWIDFNADGSWSEAGDQIFDDQALAAGVHALSFTVPATASPNVSTFARFRVSTAGGLDATGPADDGEVEDHAIVTVPVELMSFRIE